MLVAAVAQEAEGHREPLEPLELAVKHTVLVAPAGQTERRVHPVVLVEMV